MRLRALAFVSVLSLSVSAAFALAPPAAIAAPPRAGGPARPRHAKTHRKARGKAAPGKKTAKQQAIEDFKAGQDAFAKKDYKTAAESWRKAYVIIKDPLLLHNIGLAYEKAGDTADALTFYQQYVDAKPTPADAEAVKKHMAELQPPIPPPPPVSPPASAQATSAMAPPASAPASAPAAGGESSAFFAAPMGTSAPTTPAPSPAPAPEPLPPAPIVHSDSLAIAAWSGVAVTVACLAVGAGYGLAAQSHASDINRLYESRDGSNGGAEDYGNPTIRSQFDSAYSAGQNDSTIATGFFIASGVAAAATGVLFWYDERNQESEAAAADTAHFALAPAVGPGVTGLAASGSF